MFPNIARVPNNWKLFLSVFRILLIEMLHVYQRVEPNGLCSNFRRCYVQNKNVIEILTSHKRPLEAQVSLSFENQRRLNNQIKSISCFCTPNIFKSNEWTINHWQVNSSPGWYFPADIYILQRISMFVLLNTANKISVQCHFLKLRKFTEESVKHW